MHNKKLPDRIPEEILKIVVDTQPEILLDVYNFCLMVRVIFPEQWKVAKLVLIGKGKNDPSTASAHRFPCMLKEKITRRS